MLRSQNGFSAGDTSLIHSPYLPGTRIRFPQGVRKGPAGDLLMWVAKQLHERVENGGTGYGMWGYYYRTIRGATGLSNHASGTAIDWHAPRHPLGARGTFSPAQVREIRAILSQTQHSIRWGGDYTGRADEMHFEVVASEAQCARVLEQLTHNDQEDDMPTAITAQLPVGQRVTLTIPPVQGGAAGWGQAWVGLGVDGADVKVRGAAHLDGEGGWRPLFGADWGTDEVREIKTTQSRSAHSYALPKGAGKLSLQVIGVTTPDAVADSAAVSVLVEYAPR